MTVEPLAYVISERDSADFALLSGDFNPLHVDAVAARRLQFGGTVCHGVHLVLKSMDLAASHGLLDLRHVTTISAVFNGPVRTAHEVTLVAEPGSGGRLRLVGSVGGRPLYSATVTIDPAIAAHALPHLDDSEVIECCAVPHTPDFPAPGTSPSPGGQVPLKHHHALLRSLFPVLSTQPGTEALTADLMATTRIVGMECPGLHSIFAELKLRRRAAAGGPGIPAMRWRIDKADSRFRKVRLYVEGLSLEGTLDTFFRAPPVQQRSLAELCTLVPGDRFAGQRALVVGGSRGLGELAAKMVLAGGGRVLLTYANGHNDAERICQEALAQGAECQSLQLDLSSPLSPELSQRLASADITHLYHFATPQIAKGIPGTWSAPLFDTYAGIYLRGFADLIRSALGSSQAREPLRVLFPSTVFLDQPEKGFAEYCAAKAAGEVLCDHLALDGKVVVHKPRLPRLRTDQNSSFLGAKADDPYPVMDAVLEEFCSPSLGARR
jgi:hypothetical protein